MTTKNVNAYMLERYHERRKGAIALLGGKCIKCGSTDNLEIDHVNPNEKSFDVSKMWGVSIKRFNEEISKCQLLCKTCHSRKTGLENSKDIKHGTLSGYSHYKCRCADCKMRYSEWRRGRYAINGR